MKGERIEQTINITTRDINEATLSCRVGQYSLRVLIVNNFVQLDLFNSGTLS